jgi:hypothetical protein
MFYTNYHLQSNDLLLRGVEVDGIYVNRKRGCKGIRLKTTKELKEFYEQYLGSAADAAE